MTFAVDWPVNCARFATPLYSGLALLYAKNVSTAYQMVPMENAKPLPGAKYVEKIRC